MLASHFGYDSLLQELALLPAERTGGVAPLRHQVALLQHWTKQKAYREQSYAAANAAQDMSFQALKRRVNVSR